MGHAPRERVSWNFLRRRKQKSVYGHAPRERVSWNVKKLVSYQILRVSRSTWACELKCKNMENPSNTRRVTLHVSVWVEILRFAKCATSLGGSRSTWACELKFDNEVIENSSVSHAPRERVSWNALEYSDSRGQTGKSRSTWACELKYG